MEDDTPSPPFSFFPLPGNQFSGEARRSLLTATFFPPFLLLRRIYQVEHLSPFLIGASPFSLLSPRGVNSPSFPFPLLRFSEHPTCPVAENRSQRTGPLSVFHADRDPGMISSFLLSLSAVKAEREKARRYLVNFPPPLVFFQWRKYPPPPLFIQKGISRLLPRLSSRRDSFFSLSFRSREGIDTTLPLLLLQSMEKARSGELRLFIIPRPFPPPSVLFFFISFPWKVVGGKKNPLPFASVVSFSTASEPRRVLPPLLPCQIMLAQPPARGPDLLWREECRSISTPFPFVWRFCS